MQDIYYNNNANAFVVNDSTVAQSIKTKVFTLECHYLKPEIKNNQIINQWNTEFVEFQNLVQNEATKQIYFFDYEAEYQKLKQKLGLRHSYLQESKNQKIN